MEMAHGYLGDGYGSHGEIDPDREDRERARREGERDWRDRDRDWSERGSHERGRGFMFDSPDPGRGESRYGPEHGFGGFQGDYEGGRQQGGFGGYGDYAEGRRSFSAHPDDHYRSWRDRQMEALDRDYEDYCREREQQFHRDFNAWRSRRHGDPQPLQPGMTQSGLSGDPTGMTQAYEETAPETPQEPDPMATATLGAQGGRGRR
jgi:hypothetical protein